MYFLITVLSLVLQTGNNSILENNFINSDDFNHGALLSLRFETKITNSPKNEFPKIIGLPSDSKLEPTSILSKNIIMQCEKQGHSRSNMDRV